MEKKIEQFIAKHHVLTLATATNDGSPYCCNCFYAYNKAEQALIFTSDAATRHAQMFAENSRTAASIVLETRIVGRVQGLQITGHTTLATEQDKALYIKRFPYTAIADLTLWRLQADFLKLTDNTLGFGKKLIWQREEL